MRASILLPLLCLLFIFKPGISFAQVAVPKTKKAVKKENPVIVGSVDPTIVPNTNSDPVKQGKTGKLKTAAASVKTGTEKIIFPRTPVISKASTGITKTMTKGTIKYNGINQAALTTGYLDAAARQRALNDLLGMGCTMLAGNPAGVFCKTVTQFNKAFDYLQKGNIDDVQGDVSGNPNFKLTETLSNSGTFSVTGTPTLYINKNGATPKVTGKASFSLSYPVPVLGNAPGCDPNNKALSDDQYHRRLIDQQNYFVDYRNYGLFSFAASNDNGSMNGSFDVTEVDIIRAINYANSHNAWGQTFYMTMVAKAGPTFIFPDPVCTQSSSGLLGVNKEYTVVDHGQLIRPYRIVSVQLKVVSSN